MGRKPEVTDLSTRFVLATLGSERRWTRILSYAVLGAIVAGVAGYFVLRNVAATVTASLEKDWSALQGCTLGDPILPGEAPAARVRGIQLTVLGIPRDARGKPGQLGWPSDCASLASALSEHAASAEVGGAELKASASALAKAMREDPNATTDIAPQVEDVWRDAARAQLRGAPASTSSGATPKPAVALFTREGFQRPSGLKGEIALSSLQPDPSPGAVLRFLVDDKGLEGGVALCSIDGVKPALACEHLPPEVAKLSPGVTLLGTTEEGSPPWIFAGERGQLGIFRPEGKIGLSGATAYGAAAHKDGSMSLLVHEGAGAPLGLKLVHVPSTGDPAEHDAFGEGEIDAATDATLGYDWLLYVRGTKQKPPGHLIARKLSDKVEAGPVVDVGDVATFDRATRDDRLPTFSTCKSGESIAVRFHGGRSDAVSFDVGGVWSAPAALQMRGGAMTCRGNEAFVTRATPGADAAVDQAKCNPTGCTVTRVAIREMLSGTDVLPSGGAALAAADVNGKLLVAWSAGPAGGVRMRIAPADRLKDTPDTLIVDARDEGGLSSVTELRVLAAADFALLFINTTAGVKVFRADSAGKLIPLQTQL
jgi:hypothetical protein